MDEIDSWTLPYKEGSWEFRVKVYRNPDAGRPEEAKDVYRPELSDDPEDARRTIRAWENEEWEFVTVEVTPVLVLPGDSRVEFGSAAERMSGTEWGSFPQGDGTVWELGREAINAYPARELAESAVGEAERLRSLVAQTEPLEDSGDIPLISHRQSQGPGVPRFSTPGNPLPQR